MKTLIFILLFPIVSFAQMDTVKKATAWQNSFVLFGTKGLTRDNHPYLCGLNCNFNTDRTPAEMELVRIDLTTGDVSYKTLSGLLSPGNPGTSVWATTWDSTGTFYLALNYPLRRILKINLKDSIWYENLGNGFQDGASLFYSGSMGTDTHIYFGASSGDTYWSEYDPKTGTLWKHKAVDTQNDYVQKIAGDSLWAYFQVGQRNNTIKLFAVRKSDDSTVELFHITSASAFQLETKVDHHIYMSVGILDTLVGTWWLHDGQAIKISNNRNAFPVNGRMDYYEIGDYGQTRVNSFYDLYNSKVLATYQTVWGAAFPPYTSYPIKSNRQANSIKLIFSDRTKPNDFGYIGNYYGLWFWYDGAKDSTSLIGSTNFNIYSFAQRDDNHILFGSYPNGTVIEWDRTKAWTVNTYTSNGSITAATYTTNPRIVAEFRTYTPAQFHHAKYIVKVKDKYVVGGDVIRTGNTCSVGALDSSTYRYWGYDCNKIDRLSMTGMATWRDLAVIATSNQYGGTPKIYFYNPDSSVNTMVDSIQVAGWTNYAANGLFHVIGDTLIGSHGTYEWYKINLATKQVIFDTINYLYYAGGNLEDGYLWMNRPAPGNCIGQPSNCGMPATYMLRYPYYGLYSAYSFNHIVYSVTYDGFSVARIRNLYPVNGMNNSQIKVASAMFTAYPNPTKNNLHILGSGDYILIDMQGRILRRKTIINSGDMFLEQLSSGVYNLINTSTHASKKIVLMP